MKIRKILAAITSVALVGTMLAGCNNDNTSGNSNNSPAGNNDSTSTGENSGGSTPIVNDETDVKLTVWAPQEEQEILKEMCEAFAAAHPDQNVTFEYAAVGEPDAVTNVSTDIDNAADVFAFPVDQLPTLNGNGSLYPVIDVAGVKAVNTDENIALITDADGKLVAYPSVAETLCLMYDKSKITDEEAKSLEAILAKDLESGVVNFAMPLNNGFYDAGFFFANGCTVFGEDGNDPTKCDFNNEAGVEVGNYLYDLVNNSKAKVNFDDGTIVSGFQNGTLAAAITGPWNAKSVSESLGENYGVTILPTMNIGGTDKVIGSFANLKLIGVNAHTAYPKTASELAMWLTNAENQSKRALARSLGAVNTQVDASAFADNVTIAAVSAQTKYATPALHIKQADNFWTPMQGLVDDMIAGSITKDNMKESLDTVVESILTSLGE